MSLMEKIAEVNTQLAELRRQIKQRDERIAQLEQALRTMIHESRNDFLSHATVNAVEALLDPTT